MVAGGTDTVRKVDQGQSDCKEQRANGIMTWGLPSMEVSFISYGLFIPAFTCLATKNINRDKEAGTFFFAFFF